MNNLDSTVKSHLNFYLSELEKSFEADVIFLYGELGHFILRTFRDYIENIVAQKNRHNKLVFFLNTPGGSAEVVDKVRDVLHKHMSKDQVSLNKLQQFIQEMSNKGLIRKKEYDIPLVDTVGKTFFQNNSKASGITNRST